MKTKEVDKNANVKKTEEEKKIEYYVIKKKSSYER